MESNENVGDHNVNVSMVNVCLTEDFPAGD